MIKNKKLNKILISTLLLLISTPVNAIADENISLRIGLTDFFYTEKIEFAQELKQTLTEKLSSNNKISIQKIVQKDNNTNLLVSDEILELSQNKLIDFIISGTLTTINDNIILNIRVFETVTAKVVFSKDYISKKSDIKNLVDKISSDIESFRYSLPTKDINIADLNEGEALLRVSTLPTNSNIVLDGKLYGKAPVIFKNLSSEDHLIEAYIELDSTISSISVTPEDSANFNAKIDNKTFNLDSSYMDNLNLREFKLEILPQDFESRKDRVFKLDLEVIPEDAEISVNDKVYPKDKIFISEGLYSVKVLPKKLFPFIKQVDAYKKKISNININLFKLGRILVSSNPSNAEIYVDGEKSGLTPKSLDLPQGEHFLELKREGFSLESRQLNIFDDSIKEYNINLSSLKNTNTNSSIFPTGLVDNVLSTSFSFLSLGQYSKNDLAGALSYLYSGELNYGFKNIYSINKDISISPQFGIFYHKLNSLDQSLSFNHNFGTSFKVQILSQGVDMPVSLASGFSYDMSKSLSDSFNGFVAFSRDFGFLSADLGFQVNNKGLSALNLNFNYNKFYRLKIGASTLINFNLLNNKSEEYLSPLFGLNIGYNFF